MNSNVINSNNFESQRIICPMCDRDYADCPHTALTIVRYYQYRFLSLIAENERLFWELNRGKAKGK